MLFSIDLKSFFCPSWSKHHLHHLSFSFIPAKEKTDHCLSFVGGHRLNAISYVCFLVSVGKLLFDICLCFENAVHQKEGITYTSFADSMTSYSYCSSSCDCSSLRYFRKRRQRSNTLAASTDTIRINS